MARFGILSKPQRTAAAKCGQQAPFVSSAAVRSNLASAVVDAPSAARALGEAKFHAWSRPGLAGDICCKDSKTDRRATDWRIDMRKVPSMIQHGNRSYESTHLSNGNTRAGIAKSLRERNVLLRLAWSYCYFEFSLWRHDTR